MKSAFRWNRRSTPQPAMYSFWHNSRTKNLIWRKKPQKTLRNASRDGSCRSYKDWRRLDAASATTIAAKDEVSSSEVSSEQSITTLFGSTIDDRSARSHWTPSAKSVVLSWNQSLLPTPLLWARFCSIWSHFWPTTNPQNQLLIWEGTTNHDQKQWK